MELNEMGLNDERNDTNRNILNYKPSFSYRCPSPLRCKYSRPSPSPVHRW